MRRFPLFSSSLSLSLLSFRFWARRKREDRKKDEKADRARPNRSQEFFAQLMKDASAYARHAGRKHLVNEQDLVMLLTR